MVFEKFDFKEKHGIKPEKIDPSHNMCSIGFSEKEKKFYGWSHRAYFGFKVGSNVKVGDCGFVPANKEDFMDAQKSWYGNDPMYKDVEYMETPKGIEITCTIGTGKNKETSKRVEPYPAKWGKGAWTAKTLKDAKQMAIDFANAVG